jgi:selenide,water dikinase
LAPDALAQVLRELPNIKNDRVLVGYDTSDDACVYKVSDDVALINTVDFFPPMVDDPFTFGQIAAANALSDVWAMGGKPTLAMNLLCFPSCLDVSVANQILAGGADKAMEAGCTIVGGHTIADDEPKYGMCVTGFARPEEILANSTAKAGDALVLTKPLGTGVINTAIKGEVLDDKRAERMAIDTMRLLNKYAAEAAHGLDVHACTDVTGFGLIGHLCEMAEGSGVCIELRASSVPLLPKAREMAAMGVIPAGAYRNRDYFGTRVSIADGVHDDVSDLLYDPQTSGGLIFALPQADAIKLVSRLEGQGHVGAIVGRVLDKADVSLKVV